MQKFHTQHRNQQGAALVTGLLIMTIMTLIGLASMQSSIVQTKLATNSQLNAIGYQSAEIALTQVANNASLLVAAMDNGLGDNNKTTFGNDVVPTYQATLDKAASSRKNDNGDNTSATVTITPTVQVTPCGALPVEQCAGFGQNSDLSAGKTTPTCYAFNLTASIDINGQANTQHSQQTKRPIPGQQGAGAWSC